MTKEFFEQIFDDEIMPFVREIDENNSLIKIKNISLMKEELFSAYNKRKKQYKERIFEKDIDETLLDRHKIASCICGAFLECPILDKTDLMNEIINNQTKVEVYFYYVNEMVALYASTSYLSFFMVSENEDNIELIKAIVRNFPMKVPTTRSKRGFWNSVVFNLSQINDDEQIGIEHYDIYSYAMFFYWLEKYFLDNWEKS